MRHFYKLLKWTVAISLALLILLITLLVMLQELTSDLLNYLALKSK